MAVESLPCFRFYSIIYYAARFHARHIPADGKITPNRNFLQSGCIFGPLSVVLCLKAQIYQHTGATASLQSLVLFVRVIDSTYAEGGCVESSQEHKVSERDDDGC